jgi:hypothetical protein
MGMQVLWRSESLLFFLSSLFIYSVAASCLFQKRHYNWKRYR